MLCCIHRTVHFLTDFKIFCCRFRIICWTYCSRSVKGNEVLYVSSLPFLFDFIFLDGIVRSDRIFCHSSYMVVLLWYGGRLSGIYM